MIHKRTLPFTLQRYKKFLKPPYYFSCRKRPVFARFQLVFFVCGSCEDRIREPQTRLVDEDRLTFVVRTSVANCDGGLPSSSTCFLRESQVFWYPCRLATFLPTNQGSPFSLAPPDETWLFSFFLHITPKKWLCDMWLCDIKHLPKLQGGELLL